MKLIIGGAYQGKRQYAREHYGDCAVIDQFHLLALELVKQDIDLVAHVRGQLGALRDKVIICDDIFCGIVPMEPQERRWREELGRALALLAEESDEVVRVFCGLGTRIK